jgi:hypothetical protein
MIRHRDYFKDSVLTVAITDRLKHNSYGPKETKD